MNIYLKELMNRLFIYGLNTNTAKIINQPFRDDDGIIVKQLDDITVTKYTLAIYNSAVENVIAIFNGKEYVINRGTYEGHFGFKDSTNYFSGNVFYLDIDLDSFKPEAIRLTFIKNIEDPVEIGIKYIYADKELYYKRQEQAKLEEMIDRVDLTVETGNGLVTAFFGECSEDYDHASLLIYHDKKEIGKFKNKPGLKYITVKDLADTKYGLILNQYNKDNELIYSSNMIEFTIYSPSVTDDDWDDYYNEEDEYY